MQWLTMLILSLAAACDSLLIGLNYGVRHIKIPAKSNLLISLICFFGTLTAMYVGKILESFLSAAVGEFLGGLLLTALGGFMTYTAFFTQPNDYCDRVRAKPEDIDRNRSFVIESHETLSLAAVLTTNNIGVGLGASMLGFPPAATSGLCAGIGFLLLAAGCSLGGKIVHTRLASLSEKLSALILMLLGLLTLF